MGWIIGLLLIGVEGYVIWTSFGLLAAAVPELLAALIGITLMLVWAIQDIGRWIMKKIRGHQPEYDEDGIEWL